MGSFSDQLERNIDKFLKDLEEAEKSATRGALREGIKEYKKIAKPLIPKLSSNTRFRRAGALQRKFKMSVKLDKNKKGGKGSLYFSTKASRPVMLKRKRMGKTASGKQITGAVKAYRNDAFYWFMVDQGTKKMKGQHYRNKAQAAGEQRAKIKALDTYEKLIKNNMKNWR